MFKLRIICHECGFDAVDDDKRDKPTNDNAKEASAKMAQHREESGHKT